MRAIAGVLLLGLAACSSKEDPMSYGAAVRPKGPPIDAEAARAAFRTATFATG